MTITLNGTTGITTPADTVTTITSPAATALTIQSAGTIAMTIDTSQNVGIGTTSPATKLNVVGNASFGEAYAPPTSSSTINQVLVNTSSVLGSHPTYTSGSNNGGLLFNSYNFNNGSNYDAVANIIAMPETWTGNGNGSLLRFLTASTSSSSPAERMRIDSSGNLLVGMATAIGVGINSSSNFFVGSAGSYWKTTNFSATYYFAYNNSDKAAINGSTGAYTALSDANKKKDFEASIIGLAEVMQLQPKMFRMLDDADGAPKQLGFIAQEVQPLIPQAYSEQDGPDGKKFIGLQDRPIIAALTKAIQELSAKNDALEAVNAAFEARLAKLENPQ